MNRFYDEKKLRSEAAKQSGFTFAEVFHPAEWSRRITSRIIRAVAGVTSRSNSRAGFAIAHTAPYRKFGFTLAEILITLGIIGVVAALTMPSLIQNHRKHVVETRLAKFYSNINQAIKLSEIDNGEMNGWEDVGNGWGVNEDGSIDKSKNITLQWFEKYLKPYIKYTSYKVDENKNGLVLVYFSDGGMVSLSKNSFTFYPEPTVYDKKQNNIIYGKERFAFFYYPNSNDNNDTYHKNKAVEPYKHGWHGDRTVLFSNGLYGCKAKPEVDQGAYCTALIQMNGWKIPKDYPLKF